MKFFDVSENTLCVQEGSTEYNLEEKQNEKTGDKKHDKIFKEILQNRSEITQFINKFTKYKVEEQELEIYNVNYITKDFKYKQADIVYKIKGKQIYFLIEHQTKVDYSMSYRILNYCIEIIRSVVDGQEINRLAYKYPKVIPIVLYTGNKNWKASTSFAKTQFCEKGYEEKIIDISYKLIDVNKYEIEDLLKEKTMLTNIMILEKCKNNEEVISCLKKIIKNNHGEDIQNLKRIVMYLYEGIEEKSKKEIINLIKESESEENMSTIQERLRDEFINERKIGVRQGLMQAINQTIIRMLKMNLEDDFIEQATGAKKTEIEKIRKEIER